MSILSDELFNDPAGIGYAQWYPDNPGMATEFINEVRFTMVKPRTINAMTILYECPGGPAILDALEASSMTALRWYVRFLARDNSSGIDIGHPTVRADIDALVTAGGLDATLAEQLKAMAIQPCSRAEILGLGYVPIDDVQAAWQP